MLIMDVELLCLVEHVQLDLFASKINVFQKQIQHQVAHQPLVHLKIVEKKVMDVEDQLIVHPLVQVDILAKNTLALEMFAFLLQHVLRLILQILFQNVDHNQMDATIT